MNSNNIGKIILVLSVPLALLITAVSCIGIFTKDFYIKETFNWQAQCIGQYMVDIFVIAPALLLTAILAYKENRIAAFLWAGTILYILYTFIIYCFDIHFNQLFIIYCFILGLSFYSIFWFLYSQVK